MIDLGIGPPISPLVFLVGCFLVSVLLIVIGFLLGKRFGCSKKLNGSNMCNCPVIHDDTSKEKKI